MFSNNVLMFPVSIILRITCIGFFGRVIVLRCWLVLVDSCKLTLLLSLSDESVLSMGFAGDVCADAESFELSVSFYNSFIIVSHTCYSGIIGTMVLLVLFLSRRLVMAQRRSKAAGILYMWWKYRWNKHTFLNIYRLPLLHKS